MKVKRILVFGAPGSGKNYFCDKLNEKTGINAYDSDDILWKKKFITKRTVPTREKILKKIVVKDKWILGGAFRYWAEPAEKRAQLIVILNHHLFREIFRILSRWRKRRSQKIPGDTLKAHIALIKWDYKEFHKKGCGGQEYFEIVKKKYPKKTIFLGGKKEINNFLENF